MVFLVGLLDLIGAYETLQEFLAPVAPGDVLETIDTLQQDTSTGTSVVAFVVGAAGAIWAASGAMNAVIKAVNRAYDRVETRPFWKTRLIAIVLVALTGLVLAGLLLLIVFGGPLGDGDRRQGGPRRRVRARLDGPALADRVRRDPALLRARLLPGAERRRRGAGSGSRPARSSAASSWLVLSGLFALYTSFSDSYSKTYGALASGIVLLLWLNYSAFALLFGAELNSELDRQAEIRRGGRPGRRPRQAEPAALALGDPDRALDRVGLRSEKKRSMPGGRASPSTSACPWRRGRTCG